MSERSWTQEQLKAIETRDRTLLVSAAAGSGKTATLTERIIRSLMDEEDPVSVDSLLVVTFTNAAASELRTKISKALEEAVIKNPKNKRLERQLFMLPQAKIKTIDSFCADILRSNADRVGVPFNYRIADTSECELLSSSVMDGLIEAIYSSELLEVASPREFEELADCLTDSKKAEELSEVFSYLYEQLESDEKGLDALLDFAEIYDPEKFSSVGECLHGRYIIDRVKEFCADFIQAASYYKRVFSDNQRFYQLVLLDEAVVSSLAESNDYLEIKERLLAFKLENKPSEKEKTHDTLSYAKSREFLKKDVKKLLPLFNYSPEEWKSLYASLHRFTLLLYKFLSKYEELFLREKLRRGALSYADVERFAYKCLIKDGKPTDVAENIAASYSAIYIDEYQDVNGLQNSIFEAISRPDNRFMVGDIKQSIYGFRSARPEIFAGMKKAFSPLADAKEKAPASIFMSNNFRCDRAVVDFVNAVFDKAFAFVGESIGYQKEDGLVYSKLQEAEPEYITPEVCMVEKSGADDDENEEEENLSGNAPDLVAEKIELLLKEGRLNNGKPICPSDIAILMRSSSGKDHLYAEALSKRGIASKISGAKNFFLCAEVLLALCLLNSIDNPRRDIYLAGLMRSPLYSFTADELYLIKKSASGSSLYDALIKYVEESESFEKGARFLAELKKYRAISEGVCASELLFRLYHETGLLALAAESGGKENLMLLYDYACRFEAGEFSGLYSFIHFINNLIDKRTTFDEPRESAASDAVKIVTCHSSKGLEYPVVFLVDASARIRNKDASKRIAFSHELGVATRLRTPSGLSIVDNPVIDAINIGNTRKNFEEELRVLYVALTRARERLYIVGTCPKIDTEKYFEELLVLGERLSPYTLYKLSSYLEIIVATTGRMPSLACDFTKSEENGGSEKTALLEEKEARTGFDKESFADELVKRFNYEYPNEYLTKLPEKMSVSKTSPTVLDGSGEGLSTLEEKEVYQTRMPLPEFMSGTRSAESAKRGIATHYFMQFCNLERFKAEGAEAELARLVREGYISERDGKRVRVEELEAFRSSSLLADMTSAVALHRELRFNARLPVEEFTEDEEKRKAFLGRGILVQGVIDCVIEYCDGTLGLFDYKTDRLSKEELADRSLAEKTLTERHKTQLSYYAMAAERIFGKKVKNIGIYSLHLGETVLIRR